MSIMMTNAIGLNVLNHYWIIGGSTSEVYSSATNTMVPVDDQTYVDWTANNFPSQIASEAELADVLRAYGSRLPEWLLSSSSFIQPTPTTYSEDQLAAYSANKRWQKEQGGMTLSSGMPIKTDDRSQAKISGMQIAATTKGTLTTRWHAADGNFYDMSSDDVQTMSDELQEFISKCFTTESDVHDQIAAGSITTLPQIDTAFEAITTHLEKKTSTKKPTSKK